MLCRSTAPSRAVDKLTHWEEQYLLSQAKDLKHYQELSRQWDSLVHTLADPHQDVSISSSRNG